jgi:hypothetical protein
MVEAMIMRCNYAWGELVTLRVGNEFSIPLHPEHMARITAAYEDGDTACYIRDETGTEWVVECDAERVRFTEWNNRQTGCEVQRKDLFPTVA